MTSPSLPSLREAAERIARLESENARMEFALAAARACTWECDLATGRVLLSASWAAMLDEPPRPVRTTLAQLRTRVPGDDYQRVLRPAMTQMFKSPAGEYTVEHRFLNAADETIWLCTHGRITQRDPATGRALRVAGIGRDITAVKQATARQALSESRLQMLIALSSDWYWEQDAQLRYVRWTEVPDPRWQINFVGKTRWELPVADPDSPPWRSHRATVERHEPFRDFEYQLIRPDGGVSWVSVSGNPLFDGNGQFVGYCGVGRDITARRRQEQALQEAKERFELVIAASGQSVFDLDLPSGGLTVYWSRENGSASVAVVSLERILADVHPEDRPATSAAIEAARGGQAAAIRIEFRASRRGDDWRWYLFTGQVVRRDPATGLPRRISGASIDITARKAAEQQLAQLNGELRKHAEAGALALAETEARYRAVVAEAPVGIALVTRDLRILEANPRLCSILGYEPNELVGMSLRDLTPPEDHERQATRLAQMTSGRTQRLAFEKRYFRRDGSTVWAKVNVASITLQPGAVQSQVTVIEDITDRRLADQRLRDYAAQVSALSVKVLAAQERERHHIARELHDEIGQVLTAVRMALVQPRLPREDGADPFAQAKEVVDTAIGRMRRLSLNLRPPLLDDLGLRSALRELGRQHRERAGMAVDVDLPDHEPPLHRDLEIAVYRVCQEALTNVARHAHASRVAIRLDAEGDEMLLVVHDDGVGFATDAPAATDRLGIVGMRERVRLHGGRFSVTSAPGRGTTLRAWFPTQAPV